MAAKKVGKSKEDYLEAILIQTNKNGACRITDIATQLGYSKPSVSVAVTKLEEEGYVERDDWRIILTDKGMTVAKKLLDKHLFFTKWFIAVGIEENTAINEACLLEHTISDESFMKISEYLKNLDPTLDV